MHLSFTPLVSTDASVLTALTLTLFQIPEEATELACLSSKVFHFLKLRFFPSPSSPTNQNFCLCFTVQV